MTGSTISNHLGLVARILNYPVSICLNVYFEKGVFGLGFVKWMDFGEG